MLLCPHGGCGVLFPSWRKGWTCVVLSRWVCWTCYIFSFPVGVVGCVLFCAWRIGVVAGVVVPSSWALALLAECGLRRV